MLHLIFEIAIAKYAPISSSALGIFAAIAFAIPAFENRGLRRVLLQIEGLGPDISSEALHDAKAALNREARRLLKKEGNWNLLGAALLAASFLILLLNSICCAGSNAC